MSHLDDNSQLTGTGTIPNNAPRDQELLSVSPSTESEEQHGVVKIGNNENPEEDLDNNDVRESRETTGCSEKDRLELAFSATLILQEDSEMHGARQVSECLQDHVLEKSESQKSERSSIRRAISQEEDLHSEPSARTCSEHLREVPGAPCSRCSSSSELGSIADSKSSVYGTPELSSLNSRTSSPTQELKYSREEILSFRGHPTCSDFKELTDEMLKEFWTLAPDVPELMTFRKPRDFRYGQSYEMRVEKHFYNLVKREAGRIRKTVPVSIVEQVMEIYERDSDDSTESSQSDDSRNGLTPPSPGRISSEHLSDRRGYHEGYQSSRSSQNAHRTVTNQYEYPRVNNRDERFQEERRASEYRNEDRPFGTGQPRHRDGRYSNTRSSHDFPPRPEFSSSRSEYRREPSRYQDSFPRQQESFHAHRGYSSSSSGANYEVDRRNQFSNQYQDAPVPNYYQHHAPRREFPSSSDSRPNQSPWNPWKNV